MIVLMVLMMLTANRVSQCDTVLGPRDLVTLCSGMSGIQTYSIAVDTGHRTNHSVRG